MKNRFTLVGNYDLMLKGSKISTNNYLIKQLPKATVFINKKFEVVHASDKWINEFRFDEINIFGKTIFALFDNVTDDLKNILKDCLSGKSGEIRIKRYIDSQENEQWYEWSNIPWYDANENIIGIIVQTEDITKRIADELKLEKLKILLKEKSKIAKIGSWEYDALTNKITWCEMTRKIHEVDDDFVPTLENGISFYKEGHSQNTISMAIYEAAEKGSAWYEKLQIDTTTNKGKWVITTGKPIFKNNEFIGLVGTFQDIDSQVQTRIKAKESETLLKSLIDNLPVNVFIKNRELKKILVNKSECDFLGVDGPSDVLGKTDFDFYDNETAEMHRKVDLSVLNYQKAILGEETTSVKKDGTITTFLTSKIPLFNAKSEVEGIIGISLDISDIRKTQLDLEEKERYFRSIFNSSYQFTGILDIDGTLLEINDTALDFAGLKAKDLIHKKFWDAYWWPVPDYIKDGLKQIIEAAAQGEFMRSEIVVLDKNKKQVHVDFSIKPIYDSNNKIVSLMTEGRMITEMVAARVKLKESERKFRALFELSPIGYVLYDLETGEVLDFNPSFVDTTGYSKEDIDKMKYSDFELIQDKKHQNRIIKELEAKASFGPIEEVFIKKNGSSFPVMISKSLVVSKKGQKLVWAIVHDISEAEEKKKQIKEERKLLRTVIDNLPLNVYIKDTESRKLLVNKSECEYLGVQSPEELLGKTDFELYDKDVAKIYRDEDLKVMNSLKPFLSRETVIIKKDGTVTTFLTSKIPLKDDFGKAYGLVGISLDISYLKQKEEELRDLINVTSLQNKKLINFAHIVSHNLRSHTANFSMLLDFLVHEKVEDEKQNIMKMLVEASDNLLETLDNLNEVVAISTNVNQEKESINLNKKIAAVEKNLRPFLLNNNAKIINAISDEVSIKVIPAYIESILMNFITNAVKYSLPERSPIIRLSTKSQNGYTILSIKDNGTGIDLKKYGDKLFGMYKTFHNNQDARGIGLYITKNQIEAMNGKVMVSSELGKGTTFNIYFNEKN
ncbi:MAG: PAS domain S-box protein [Flavobacteriaceae bacterium]